MSNYLKTRGCLCKHSYPRRQAALAAMNYSKRRLGQDEELEVYHCRFCRKWHVGHSRNTPNKRRILFGMGKELYG